MTRWGSAMPLEPAGRRGLPSRAKFWSRGSVDMPDGVFAPEIIARHLGGALAREAHRLQTTRPEPGTIITISGSQVPADEIRERERLLGRIRTGDRQATADAAQELWATRRAWIVTCPGPGGGDDASRARPSRGACESGPAAPPTNEEA